MTSLAIITDDVKRYVIRPLLDPFSLLSFKKAWEWREFTQGDFNERIAEAIVSHGAPLVKIYYDFIKNYNLYTMAAKTDRLDVLQYVNERKHPMWVNCSLAAARYGRLNQLEFIYKEIGWSTGALRAAVENGHIHILQYVYDNLPISYFIPSNIMDIAAEKGDIAIMKLIHEKQGNKSYNAVSTAAAAGQLDAVKFLCENNYSFGSEAAGLAIKGGHISIVKYLIEKDNRLNTNYLLNEAARRGQLEILKYLRQKRFPWDESIYYNSIKEKQMSILQYAFENGCPSTTNLCYLAASFGNLEALSYFHEHNVSWGEDVCEIAAEKGYLNILQYAHTHGCPWTSRVCDLAIQHNNLYILEYALDQGLTLENQ